MKNRRKVKFINSPLQKKLLFFIFMSAIIPSAVVAACLYYLIFNLLAQQIGIPEAIAYNLLPVVQKVNIIIAVALPFSLLIIWRIALELSHRIAGPLFRITKELNEITSGTKRRPIALREKDELHTLAKKINGIIGDSK